MLDGFLKHGWIAVLGSAPASLTFHRASKGRRELDYPPLNPDRPGWPMRYPAERQRAFLAAPVARAAGSRRPSSFRHALSTARKIDTRFRAGSTGGNIRLQPSQGRRSSEGVDHAQPAKRRKSRSPVISSETPCSRQSATMCASHVRSTKPIESCFDGVGKLSRRVSAGATET